jgi:hypothetical protein
MTSRPWKQWPAQSPSEDFASRTVDLLLQSEAKVVPLRRRRRRWVAVLAFAAVLAAGTSWAMIRHMAPSQPAAAVSVAPPASTPPIAPPIESPAARFIAPRTEPSAEPPAASPPPRVVAPASAPPASASAAPPPKAIVVPRCSCEPGTQICACVN